MLSSPLVALLKDGRFMLEFVTSSGFCCKVTVECYIRLVMQICCQVNFGRKQSKETVDFRFICQRTLSNNSFASRSRQVIGLMFDRRKVIGLMLDRGKVIGLMLDRGKVIGLMLDRVKVIGLKDKTR